MFYLHQKYWISRIIIPCLRTILCFTPVLFFLLEHITYASNVGMPHVLSPSGTLKGKAVERIHASTENKIQKTNDKPTLSKVPVFSDGQMAFPSNAQAFHGVWHASVNPRTGMAAFNFTLSSFIYNSGLASRSLKLSYSGSPVPGGPNPFNLGPQWQFNIGTERLSATEIAGRRIIEINTGEGHAFTMIRNRGIKEDSEWRPLRYKPKDVKIVGHPGEWTVLFASGQRIHIRNGYEDWEDFQDGSRVWLYYNNKNFGNTSRRLRYLCPHPLTSAQVQQRLDNPCKEGIQLVWENNLVKINGRQKITLRKTTNAEVNQISRIDFAALSSNGLSGHGNTDSIRFSYDFEGNHPWLMRHVQYPGGFGNLFLYNHESDRAGPLTSGLSVGRNHIRLPVVTEEIIQSGNKAIPDKYIWFEYGNRSGNEHNYTGYQGNRIMIPGRDNLLDRADNYTYQVTRDDGFSHTTTTYNKYQLPLRTSVRDNQSNTLVALDKRVYPAWKNKTYSELSPTFFLPVRVKKTLFSLMDSGKDTSTPVELTQMVKYDKLGRPVWQRSAMGEEKYIQYCPPEGDLHCPKRPGNYEYPDMALPEKIIMLPGGASTYEQHKDTQKQGSDSFPVIEQVFDYIYLPPAFSVNTSQMSRQDLAQSMNRTRWKLSEKSTGALPLSVISRLKPGFPLPELAKNNIAAKSHYEYNMRSGSRDFGKLTHVSVIKSRLPPSLRQGLSATDILAKKQEADFYVLYDVNAKTGVRSTEVSVSPAKLSGQKNDQKKEGNMAAGSTSFLGKNTYSITSGLKLESRDTLGEKKVRWEYDYWDRPVKKIITLSHGGRPRTVRWHYIVNRNEIAVVMTGPNGNQYKSVRGPNGEVISTWHRFSNWSNRSMEGFSGWIPDSAYTYTRTGKPETLTIWHAADPQEGKPGKAVALVTRWGYDALGRKIWERKPDGHINFSIMDDTRQRAIGYDAVISKEGKVIFGSLLRVIDSDLKGQPVAVYLFSMSPLARKNGHFLYTPAMRKHLEVLTSEYKKPEALKVLGDNGLLLPGGKQGLASFINRAITEKTWLSRTLNKYDGNDHLIERDVGKGRKVQWYWEKGQLAKTVFPDGRVMGVLTDIQGKDSMRCLIPTNRNTCHILGRRGFDISGNLIWQEDSAGNIIRHHYDDDGRLLSTQLPSDRPGKTGHVISWEYNSIGPIVRRLDGKVIERFQYDPVTWRLTDKEDNISHLRYFYDRFGRVIRITRTSPKWLRSPQGIHYPEGTTNIQYDRYNKPVMFENIAGYRYVTTHDDLGRTLSRYIIFPGQKKKTLLTTTWYDEFSRVKRIKNGIGITRTITRDDSGRVKSTVDYRGNTFIQRLDYSWDVESGNLVRLVRTEKEASAIREYRYDKENNLKKMTCHSSVKGGLPLLCPRETDLSGSALSKPPFIVEQEYGFDSWNNIHKVRERLMTDQGTITTKTTIYHHEGEKNKNGRFDPFRISDIETLWEGQRYNATPHKIVWDQSGRMIQDGAGNRLYYNALGQQSAFLNIQTKYLTRYTYDSSGHQVAVQIFNNKNNEIQMPLYMVYQGNHISLQFQEDSGHRMHVISEPGGIARSINGQITRWYLHNYKGDVISVLDEKGTVISDNVYSPYGMRYDRLSQKKQTLDDNASLAAEMPLWQEHQSGFSGAMSDMSTGYQFLGGGYRAYNPVYRHFMSEDSFSPFVKIDGYGYGDNNPVLNVDPSGHLSNQINFVVGGLFVALSVALSILTPTLAFEALSVTPLASNASLGSLFVAMLGGGGTVASGIASGAIQMVRAGTHYSSTLSIGSGVFGIINAASIGLMGLGSGIAGMISYGASLELCVQPVAALSGIVGMMAGISGGVPSSLMIAAGANKKNPEKFERDIRYANFASTIIILASIACMGFAGLVKGINRIWFSSNNVENNSLEEGVYNALQRDRLVVSGRRMLQHDVDIQATELPDVSGESPPPLPDYYDLEDIQELENNQGFENDSVFERESYGPSMESYEIMDSAADTLESRMYSLVSNHSHSVGVERALHVMVSRNVLTEASMTDLEHSDSPGLVAIETLREARIDSRQEEPLSQHSSRLSSVEEEETEL